MSEDAPQQTVDTGADDAHQNGCLGSSAAADAVPGDQQSIADPEGCTGKITKLALKARIKQELEAIQSGLPAIDDGKPLPNQVLRSALFAISPKVFRRETKVASIDGIDVYITRGYRPTQAHLDVWEHCLKLASEQGTGKRITFTGYAFLKAIGRSTGRSDYKWLKDMLYDLAGCLVRISDGQRSYFGALIEGGVIDEKTEDFVIEINPRLAVLFMGGCWTALNQKQRAALRRQPLAQWLHAFYSTHARPHRYSVEKIRELCGSEVEELWKFRQLLRRALEHLSKTTGWRCYIDKCDCVVVEKQEPCQTPIGIAGMLETPKLSTESD